MNQDRDQVNKGAKVKQIKVSAPGKLMLFWEHAVIYDRPCIVTAVNHRISTEVEILDGKKITINAPEVEINNYQKSIDKLSSDSDLPKGVRFVETAVGNFFNKYKLSSGLKIQTKSEFSSQFGFGSSSAVTVGALKALSILFDIKMSKRDLFDLAYKTVLDVQGVGSGFDIAAGIWGGTLYFVKGGKKIIPLNVKDLPLIVGYTGIKAPTAPLVRQVSKLRDEYPNLVDGIFDIIESITNKSKDVLNKENFDLETLGKLFNLNQGLLDSLGVNTIELSNLIYGAREAGATGAKLSGAGGGDCMIALGEKFEKIKKGIRNEGGQIIPVDINAEGVRRESIK